MNRRVLVVGICTAAAVQIAAASTLGGVRPRQLAASSAAASRCDSSGVVVTAARTPASQTIPSVSVSSISAACNGGTVRVQAMGASGVLASGGPTTIASGGAVVTFASAPSESSVTSWEVIVGAP